MVPASEHAAACAALLPAAIRRQRPLLRRLIPEPVLADGLRAVVRSALERSTDRSGATRWKQRSPELPATVDDLLARMVSTPHGPALLELRFRGLDPDFPFVEVVGTGFDVTAQTLPALVDAARRQWPAAPLRALGLWVGPHEGWQPPGEGDMILVVGRLSALSRDPGPLTTTPATLESLPRIQAAYARFHADRPDLAPNVHPIEADDLAALIEAQTAADAWLDGEWAGLLAVKSAPLLGAPGLEVYEEILAPHLRGRGLGAPLQRAGLAMLPGTDHLVWGTIHHDNLPSRRTAARVGRAEVDQRWFVPVSEIATE